MDGASKNRPQIRTPIFIRHGGRQAPRPLKTETLLLDITALLLLYNLDILAPTHHAFGPLRITPGVRTSLLAHIDDLFSGQPDVDSAREEVVRLIDEKRIEVWNAPPEKPGEPNLRNGLPLEWWAGLNEIRDRGGVVIDYLPKTAVGTSERVDLAEEDLQMFSSVRAILGAMRRGGRITQAEADRAEALLPEENYGGAVAVPTPAQPVLLAGNIAEVLSTAGVLSSAADTFKLLILASDAEWVKVEATKRSARQRVGEKTKQLLDYITGNRGFIDVPLEGAVKPRPDDPDAALLCIDQLLHVQAGEVYPVAIDDRFFNGFEKLGDRPITSTLDILETLRSQRFITDRAYYGVRHRLRRGDFRYIPLSSDELLHHLLSAEVVNGRLTETPELFTLRTYFAAPLGDGGTLQWPPLSFATSRPEGEIAYVVNSAATMADALAALFQRDADVVDSRIRADWLLRYMWTPPDVFPRIASHTGAKEAFIASAQEDAEGIGTHLLIAKGIDRGAFGSPERLRQYMSWIEDRLLRDDSSIAAAQRAVVKSVAKHLEAPIGNKMERLARKVILGEWLLGLPKGLRTAIRLPERLERKLSIRTQETVNVGDARFSATEFWSAVEKLDSESSVDLKTVNDDGLYTVRKEHAGPGEFSLILESKATTAKFRMADDLLELAHGNLDRREETLRRHPEWLDSPKYSKPTSARKLASLPSLGERLVFVAESRKQSAWNHYEELARSFNNPSGPSLEMFRPPSSDELRHFLRLPKQAKEISSRTYEACAKRLIREVGVREAVRRLSLVPRNLPISAVKAFDALPRADQDDCVRILAENPDLPTTEGHLLRLHLRRSDFTAAAEIIRKSSNPKNDEIAGLQALLRWTWHRFGLPPNDEELSAAERLLFTWIHAGLIFGMTRRVSGPDQIEKFFTRYDESSPAEYISGAEGELDAASVANATENVVLLTAISSSLHVERISSDEVASDLPALLVSACFHSRNNLRWPQIPWLRDPTAHPNRIDSYLGRPRDVEFAEAIGKNLAAELSSQRVFRELDALVSALEKEPGQPQAWLLAGVLLRGQPCPPALRERLRNIYSRNSIAALDLPENSYIAATAVLAGHAWEIGGSEFVKVAERELVAFARKLREQSFGASKDGPKHGAVMFAVQTLSRLAPKKYAADVFCKATLAVLAEWPDLIHSVVNACDVLTALPAEDLGAIVPLLLEIRRTAPQVVG